MNIWLLEAEVKRAIMMAKRNGITITAERQREFMALYGDATGAAESRIMTIAGTYAEIFVQGVLTQNRDYFAYYYGGGNTTYPEIIQAIKIADSNESIEKIKMVLESPGGEIAGLLECIKAMDACSKPIEVVVPNIVASAAYALASHGKSITVKNRATRVGCIGIMVEMGIHKDTVKISNTESPKKCPDVATPEGQALVREELDAVYQVFIDTIATGRKTTIETVNANYGQGATLLAEEALKRGMIDAIETADTTSNSSTARVGGTKTEARKMDLKTLKASHPDVYAEAVRDGINAERDRVTAHLIMGETSGSLDTAVKAVKDGTEMTATMTATYMAAGMNKTNIQARAQDDKNGAAPAADGAAKGKESDSGDSVASIIEAKLGIKVQA